MKIDLFQEKYFNLILIQNKSIDYLQIYKEKSRIKVLKRSKIEADIYKDGILKVINLGSALELLIEKFKIKEFGIILDLPNIIFKKISLAKTSKTQETVFNYLKTNLPLPIENYVFYYKEEGFKPIGSQTNFSLFLIDKSLIEKILQITERNNLVPLFITTEPEVFFQYLINRSFIEFNEEYLIFFLSRDNIFAFLIKNFLIEKLIIEDYNDQKSNINSIILKIYNFLKKDLTTKTKIFFFIGKEKIDVSEFSQPVTFFEVTYDNIILDGSNLIFNYLFKNKDIVDFLPFKNYFAYFFNRLPNIIIFLTSYLILLSIFSSALFFTFYYKFNKEKAKIAIEKQKTNVYSSDEENLNYLLKARDVLNPEILAKIYQFKDIIKISEFQDINYQNGNLIFSLRTNKEKLNELKFNISKNFPQARILEEITLEDEVNLKYTF